MKKLSKFVRLMVAATLVLTLAFALCGNALATAPAANPPITLDPPLPPPIYQPFSANPMVLDGTEYDPAAGALILSFKLEDASKINLLMEYVYPAYMLEDELKALEQHLDLKRMLEKKIYSWQVEKGILKDWLSADTLSAIAGCDAYQALRIIQQHTEYQTDANVKRFVDDYLNQTLAGSQVKWAAQRLFCENTIYTDLELFTPRELCDYLRQETKSARFQRLMEACEPLKGCSKDAAALKQIFSDSELAQIYQDLRSAGEYYWPSYISLMEGVRFSWSVPLPSATKQ